MKVVTYMMMLMAEIVILADWAHMTDGVTAIVGAIIIGGAFGWVFVRIAEFKEG